MKQALFSFAFLGLLAGIGMGGIPGKHELPEGTKNFGQAVKGLAHMYPGAVADHIADQKNGD